MNLSRNKLFFSMNSENHRNSEITSITIKPLKHLAETEALAVHEPCIPLFLRKSSSSVIYALRAKLN